MVYITNEVFNHIQEKLLPELSSKGITLKLDFDTNAVYTNGIGCSGYFDYEEKELVTAVGEKPLRDWFTTLLHEYSHFEQWKENCPAWEASQRIKNSDHILDEWLIKSTEYDNISEILKDIAFLEFDCEVRTAEKVEQFPHIIDPEVYIQKSNAYIAFYRQVLAKRQWYNPAEAPYLNEEIWKKMPRVFLLFEEYWEDYKFDHINWESCL